jgi:hypothetical protein
MYVISSDYVIELWAPGLRDYILSAQEWSL